jgi:hypothetical protein
MNSRFHFAITLLLTFPLLSQTGNDTGRQCGRSSRLLTRAITDEDKVIENYKIVVKPADVTIVPADKVFQ